MILFQNTRMNKFINSNEQKKKKCVYSDVFVN